MGFKEIKSQELLNIITRSETNYRYKIIYEDLDIGCGYIYKCLCSNIGPRKIIDGHTLTVPTSKMVNWFKYLYDNKVDCVVYMPRNQKHTEEVVELIKNIGK